MQWIILQLAFSFISSQAVVVDRTVYVSGQLGIDLSTNKLVEGGAGPQAKLALIHLENILKASGSSIANVVKTTIFLNDITDYVAVNTEYAKGILNFRH